MRGFFFIKLYFLFLNIQLSLDILRSVDGISAKVNDGTTGIVDDIGITLLLTDSVDSILNFVKNGLQQLFLLLSHFLFGIGAELLDAVFHVNDFFFLGLFDNEAWLAS